MMDRVISHYRVTGELARGGMGVVYKAEDLVLHRPVVLKFLPDQIASDPLSLARFHREARLASALNHPGICTIYEIGQQNGTPFIAMEFVDGVPLKQLIRDGAIAVEAAVDWAIGIADALDAAHTRGIIHRDIKSANILITSRGQPKILDFGLAKVVQAESRRDPPDAEDTLTEVHGGDDLTHPGVVAGTAAYMSPEQVRGEPLDERSDIFSFGVVLYEMFTGTLPFRGESYFLLAREILERTPPDPALLDPALPAQLAPIIGKALEKDAAKRYQHAAEIRADLHRARQELRDSSHLSSLGLQHTEADSRPGMTVSPTRTSGATPAWRVSRRRRAAVVAAGALLLAIGAALGIHWLRGRQSVPYGQIAERQLTHNPSENRLISAAITADGRNLVYVDPKGLHLSVIDTGEVHDIQLPDSVGEHLWGVTCFPDGERVLLTTFSEESGWVVWLASIFGGMPRELRADAAWPAISPRGSSVAFLSGDRREIWLMGPAGEAPHRLLAPRDEQIGNVAWSPDGSRLAYTATTEDQTSSSIESIAADGSSHTMVISGAQEKLSLVWLPDGRILFDRLEGSVGDYKANLWSIRADSRTGKPLGSASRLTNWDEIMPFSPSVSADGSRLVVAKYHVRDDIYVGELRDGEKRLASPARLTFSESQDFPAAWTEDSHAVLFDSNRFGRSQIFVQKIGEESAVPLLEGSDDQTQPELTPDHRWILYWSSAHVVSGAPPPVRKLMRLPVRGGPPEPLLELSNSPSVGFHCPVHAPASCMISEWRDGRLIFYALDLTSGRRRPVAETKLDSPADLDWNISANGASIALASEDQLPQKLRIISTIGAGEQQISLPAGWHIWAVSWSPGDKALLLAVQTTGYFLAHVTLQGESHILLNGGRTEWLSSPCPSPDGRYLAFSRRTFQSNAWLLEHF